MSSRLARLKPGARRTTHLLLAASLWTCVGILLMCRGMGWLYEAGLAVFALPAILLGFLKSHFVLDRTAAKSIHRILLFDDGTCLGAVYSKMTWLLVLGMMGMGMVLRHLSVPRPILGGIYITIGWALFWSSRNGWRAWWRTHDK